MPAKLREGCEDELLTIGAPDRRAVRCTDPFVGEHNRYRRSDRQTFAQDGKLATEFSDSRDSIGSRADCLARREETKKRVILQL